MNRFTKYTLLLGVLILAAAATTGAVVYAYRTRGCFTVGGEWLIPVIAIAARAVWQEVKKLAGAVKGDTYGLGRKKDC